MRAYERFLKYIQYDTASDERSETCPSTEKQKILGQALVEEMLGMGIADARMDEYGYVYGSIPANVESQPTMGLIAHMDVIDAVPCQPMHADIVQDYDGGVLTLTNGTTRLDPKEMPELLDCVGKDLIVTDGNTILGADDKAGVAEILTLAERILQHPEIRHGRIAIGFTPDEEIGRGADKFDVQGFGAEFAYTVDGGKLGGIDYETFNAATGIVRVHGVNVHPGSGKNRMKNASLIAMEFNQMLPPAEIPAHTEGYEGFYHLLEMSGNEELAKLHYIIRDHDMDVFTRRKERFLAIGAYLNDKYGEGTVEVEAIDSYYNMLEALKPHMHVVERAENAYRAVGITPFSEPVRGGTDGCRLSYMGLPCPNLATGGMGGHGRRECIAIQDMDTMVDVLEALVRVD